MFNGLEHVRTYLIFSNKIFGDQINKLDKVRSKLSQKGFKANVEKSFFARNELKYLGFRISKQQIIPLLDKVEGIKNIAVPTTIKKQLRSFIGLINYHRDMWQHRSKIITPLSSITSKQAKWNWRK